MQSADPFEFVPAGLGPALKARGFESLTPVQTSVLAEGTSGRDLRVSSQTGSGKTVATVTTLAMGWIFSGKSFNGKKGLGSES